jgi:hypothetical protein
VTATYDHVFDTPFPYLNSTTSRAMIWGRNTADGSSKLTSIFLYCDRRRCGSSWSGSSCWADRGGTLCRSRPPRCCGKRGYESQVEIQKYAFRSLRNDVIALYRVRARNPSAQWVPFKAGRRFVNPTKLNFDITEDSGSIAQTGRVVTSFLDNAGLAA